jgi:hypothetical protein
MGIAERFMGQTSPECPPGAMTANPAIGRAPSYGLLFLDKLDLDEDALTLALRSVHPSLGQGRAELLPVTLENASAEEAQSIIGLAGWANHIVKLVGFNAPVPQEVFDLCVRPAHFSEQLKDEAQRHQSHLLLYYAGYAADPLEQYVALTAVAAALSRFGAILLINETGRLAFPVGALPEHDVLDALRALPIPLLYSGFAKIEIEDEPGVWMRTFGNDMLNLPDLSFKAEGHHQGAETFDMFANMLAYLRESGSRFAAGHTMQVGDDVHMRLRRPTAEEWILDSEGEMFVAEKIAARDANQSAS